MSRPVFVTSRRQPQPPHRRLELPKPMPRRRPFDLVEALLASVIIAGLIAAVLLGFAAVLGGVYAVLWLVQKLVELVNG